ncbi:hypothetical protein M0805_004164 [Coniferiporia weirii]|nr:hypothetical protein M0805_004164 [Coniferiporia weirii]
MKRVASDPPPPPKKLKVSQQPMSTDDSADWATVAKSKAAKQRQFLFLRSVCLPDAHSSPVVHALPSKPQQPNPFASLLQNDDGWEKVEKRKAKKARKTEDRIDDSPPRFFYANSDIVKRKEAIAIGDIRELVLHLLGEAGPQPWLKVENRLAIKKVLVLFVPGVLPEHIGVDLHPVSATVNPNLPVSIPLPRDPSSSSAPPPAPVPVVVKTLFGGTREIIPNVKPESATPTTKLPFLARTFSHACPTRAPGDAQRMHSVLSAFFNGPVPSDERRRRAAASAKASKGKNTDPADLLSYVLTPAQMRENEYPLPSYMCDASEGPGHDGVDWEETPEPEPEPEPKQTDASGGEGEGDSAVPTPTLSPVEVFAADCEMCLTEDGKALTRLCVVAYATGEILLDELVKPPKPITDYLTQWSGITEEMLRPVTTPLASARLALVSILTASRARTGRTPILLGHSLENDLRALRLAHPRIADTALLFHHPRGRPRKPGLAWLTQKWCGREIQHRPGGGHDPREDALACAELLRRKIAGGPGFGEFRSAAESESVWERLRRSVRGSSSGDPGTGEGAHLRTALVDRGNPSTWHAPGAGAGRTLACASDAEVVQGILQCVDECDFVWARLSGLAEAQGWLQQRSSSTPAPAPAPDPEDTTTAFNTLNSHLALVHASLPSRTALVVFTGHGDPRGMSALQARRAAFENALRAAGTGAGGATSRLPEEVRWTSADARTLEETVERTKQGLLFLCLK